MGQHRQAHLDRPRASIAMTLAEWAKLERGGRLLAVSLPSISLKSGMGAEGWEPCLQTE